MNSLVVYAPLPAELAATFPSPKPGHLPVHLTLHWVGRFAVDAPAFDRVCKALESVHVRQAVKLGKLAYFPHERGRIAHVTVEPLDDLRALNAAIDSRIREQGVVPSDPLGDEYNPHVTLGFLLGRRAWHRYVPRGGWMIDTIEVRHGKRYATLPLT